MLRREVCVVRILAPELANVADGVAAPDADVRGPGGPSERQEQLHPGGLPERAHMLQVLEEASLLGRTAHGAEGPLVLYEPEDILALDYVNEYGDWRLHTILESYVLWDMTLVTQADVRKPRCFDGHRSGSVPTMSSPESDKVGAFGHAVSPLNH
jgi:hypothetical protein